MRILVLVLALLAGACGCSTTISQAVLFSHEIEFYRNTQLMRDYNPSPGDSHGVFYDRLKERSPEAFGFNVLEVESEEIWGGYAPHVSLLVVNKVLPPNGKLETLAHELGHVLQPADLRAPRADIFAEAVSHLVCKALGLQNNRQALAYMLTVIPAWAAPEQEVKRLAPEIDAAVARIVEVAQREYSPAEGR